MRAVILNPKAISFPGGGERFALLLGKALEERGFSVRFAMLSDLPQATDLLVLNGGSGTLLWSGALWIPRAQHVWVIPHESLFHAALFAYPPFQREVALLLSRLLAPAFNFWKKRKRVYLIAVSSQNWEHLKSVFSVEPVCIPNGVDVKPKVSDKVKMFMYKLDGLSRGLVVSRWDWAKNPRILLQLANTLPQDMALIMRTTPDGTLALKVKFGLDRWPPVERPNLIWLNESLPQEELWGLMSVVDFVLAPSAYEAFGYVVVEAAALGVPVFTTPVGIGKEFENHPILQNLLLRVPPHGNQTPEAVWLQIRNVLSDSELLVALKQHLRVFASKYTLEIWERNLDILISKTFRRNA